MSHATGRAMRARVGRGGRLVIPAALRHRLGFEPGAEVLIQETNDGALEVTTAAAGLRKARELVRRYIEPGDRLVDELLTERRREVDRER